jgi:hypothetical protein
MYWSIVYVYTCRTEQLAENIQPDAPIGLVLEHLYRTAGLCVAVRQYINGKPSARTSSSRPAFGRGSRSQTRPSAHVKLNRIVSATPAQQESARHAPTSPRAFAPAPNSEMQ